jgi:excisionase family DNA binding protein
MALSSNKRENRLMINQERLLLKGHEVAETLGISRALAYRWMANGILPVVKVQGSRSTRVPTEALRKWVDSQTQNAETK